MTTKMCKTLHIRSQMSNSFSFAGWMSSTELSLWTRQIYGPALHSKSSTCPVESRLGTRHLVPGLAECYGVCLGLHCMYSHSGMQAGAGATCGTIWQL